MAAIKVICCIFEVSIVTMLLSWVFNHLKTGAASVYAVKQICNGYSITFCLISTKIALKHGWNMAETLKYPFSTLDLGTKFNSVQTFERHYIVTS